MLKTRKESQGEAVKIMKSVQHIIHSSGFVMMADLDRKCPVLMDTKNNEEFHFSVGGELIDE